MVCRGVRVVKEVNKHLFTFSWIKFHVTRDGEIIQYNATTLSKRIKFLGGIIFKAMV